MTNVYNRYQIRLEPYMDGVKLFHEGCGAEIIVHHGGLLFATKVLSKLNELFEVNTNNTWEGYNFSQIRNMYPELKRYVGIRKCWSNYINLNHAMTYAFGLVYKAKETESETSETINKCLDLIDLKRVDFSLYGVRELNDFVKEGIRYGNISKTR